MNRAALTIELLAQDGKAPSEFRIFAAGHIETTKGIFSFDAKAAESVMAAVADWGNDYCVDYGHSMLSFFNVDPAEAMKAAGWFTPTLRAGELWASNVQWTDKAAGMLSAREARYISPAFNYDDDGSITELVNVALTNIPATKKQIPLVASRDGGRTTYRKEHKRMGKKNRVNAFVLFDLGLPPDAGADDVRTALAGLKERSRAAALTKEKLEADARAKAEADERARKAREGETDLATLAAKGAGEAAHAEKTRADSEKQLIDMTGAKSYGEALGMVLSLKNTAGEVEKLQARIAQLEHEGAGTAGEVLVDQGVRDGKIPPAQREMWLGIAKNESGVEILKGFLKTASTVVPRKIAVSPEHKPQVALTAEQARAAAKMGITKPEDLKKLQEQMAESAALRAAG